LFIRFALKFLTEVIRLVILILKKIIFGLKDFYERISV